MNKYAYLYQSAVTTPKCSEKVSALAVLPTKKLGFGPGTPFRCQYE